MANIMAITNICVYVLIIMAYDNVYMKTSYNICIFYFYNMCNMNIYVYVAHISFQEK